MSTCDHSLVLRMTSLARADWESEPFRGQRWTCTECSTSVYARSESEALAALAEHVGPLGSLVGPKKAEP